MSNHQSFPVTITGMNITERNTQPPRFKSPVDKVGITIQQTNVIASDGTNLVIPAGSWLNGTCPPGAMDDVAVGQTVEVSISAKPKGDGSFWYNFNYFPTKKPAPAPVSAATPTAATPTADYVTREEFNAAINGLNQQIADLANEVNF